MESCNINLNGLLYALICKPLTMFPNRSSAEFRFPVDKRFSPAPGYPLIPFLGDAKKRKGQKVLFSKISLPLKAALLHFTEKEMFSRL